MHDMACISKMTCRKSGSLVPCDNCTPAVHPRQAEILKNNYHCFMRRAQNTDNWEYKAECVKAAETAAREYYEITGRILG